MAKFQWRGDLVKNLDEFDTKAQRAMYVAGQQIATAATAHMKASAPWTDQTGNARNGLAARVYSTKRLTAVVLYHQVPYGIFLEVRWSGKYAVIMPTIEVMGPRFASLVAKMLF